MVHEEPPEIDETDPDVIPNQYGEFSFIVLFFYIATESNIIFELNSMHNFHTNKIHSRNYHERDGML